jgi:hypothetical protein
MKNALRRAKRFRIVALALAIVVAADPLYAAPCCDAKSPFGPGEEYPAIPAACDNVESWADRAPDTQARITMGVRGRLSAVNFDGTLAYLVMCEQPGAQVLCVTYSTNGMKAGDTVLFAGGYGRFNKKQIVLDPCLASRE